MANPIGQYLKETRSELNHVAWPTQTQTIVYTLLVAAISLGIAAYLGLFDFLFTTGIANIAGAAANSSAVQTTQQTAATSTQTPVTTGPVFNVTPGTTPAPTPSTQTQ